jgi:hypothetical protein
MWDVVLEVDDRFGSLRDGANDGSSHEPTTQTSQLLSLDG